MIGTSAAANREALIPPDIRAVLFDVDGTLYRQVPLRALMAFELTACSLAKISSRAASLRLVSAAMAFWIIDSAVDPISSTRLSRS